MKIFTKTDKAHERFFSFFLLLFFFFIIQKNNISAQNNAAVGSLTPSISCKATDTEKPKARCKNTRIYLDSVGIAVPRLDSINNGSTDNCGLDSLWLAPNFFICTDPDSVRITLFVRDSAKNLDFCTVKIPVFDTIRPKARCRPDISISLDDAGEASVIPRSIDEGSWDNCSLIFSVSQSFFNCKDVGRDVPIWFFAQDSSKNKDSCRVVVSVSDNTSPIARCQNVEIELNTEGVARLTPEMLNGGSTDNCQNLRFELPDTLFDCRKIGKHNVFLSVKDGAGNLALCQSQITVVNNLKPVVKCRNTTVFLDKNGQAKLALSAIDTGSFSNCEAGKTLDLTDFTCENIGENTVTLTIRDNQGRESACQAQVTVRDTVSPIVRCRAATVFLDSAGKGSLDFKQIEVSTSDNCGIETFILSKAAFDCANLDNNFVTLTAVDKHQNRSSCVAQVTVRDTITPSVFCPKDTIVQLPRLGCSAPVTFPDAQVSDNCKTTISQVAGGRSGSLFRSGENLVTFQAADFSSNTSRCTFKIKVLDHPTTGTLICRSNLTVSLDQLCQAPILPKDLLMGVDYRCFDSYQIRLTLSNVALPDNILRAEQIGKIIVARVFDSVSQNSCSANIRVVDNAPPVVEAAKDTIIPCAIANILDAPPPSELNQPRILNECLPTSTRYADIPYTLPCNFNTRRPPFGFPDYVPYDSIKAKNCVRIVWRTFYTEDAAGNLTVSYQVIYIKRADFSQIICPPQTITIRCDNGLPLNILPDTAFISGRKVPGTGRPRLRENFILPQNACGFSANYTDEVTKKDEGSYTIRRRWLISGGCTNTLDSCIQIISVEDLRPVLTCKTANFAINSNKTARFGVSQLIENVSDKCTPRDRLTLGMRRVGQGSGFPTDTILSFGCSNLGTQNIEIWVRDEAGFTAVCTTSVRIEDPTNACFVPPPPPPPPPPPVTTPLSISGTISNPNGRTFKADLALTNTATNVNLTQNSAAFNFGNVPRNQNYRLRANRNGDWRNGLTTADIAILMQHILDIEPLTSPYQFVAADIDANGTIDVADAFSLRQLALRRIDSVSGGKSWVFIPKKYVFPPNADPIAEGFSQEYFFSNLRDTIRDADFVAIKSGDLNYSARETSANFSGVETSLVARNMISPLIFNIENKKIKAGEKVETRLEPVDNQYFAGFQFGLQATSKINGFVGSLLRIEKIGNDGFSDFYEKNNTAVYENENAVGVSWNGKWQSENGLILTAHALRDGFLKDAFELSDALILAEAFNEKGQTTRVLLNFYEKNTTNTEGVNSSEKLRLMDNFPNPFSEKTTIRFIAPTISDVTLTVFDLSGKSIFTKKQLTQRGVNILDIDLSSRAPNGVLMYKLSDEKTVVFGKMVKGK